jgi:hypothetical protein
MAILIVMVFCSLAVIWYFHVKKTHHGDIWTTAIIPGLGGAGMIYALVLLFRHLAFAGGAASGSVFYKLIPYIVLAFFLVGLGAALWLRSSQRDVYDAIGRTVLEEAHER